MGVCYGTPNFPTPSHPGHLKPGTKWPTSSSSSSATSNTHDLLAAHDKKAFGYGKIVPHPCLTVFSVAELKEATNNFRPSAMVGRGGFGSVFKGMLHGKQQSGRTKTIIAVKILNWNGTQGYTEWRREIDFLGRLSHTNLVKLLGFCQENELLALVYEYMPMHSLEDQLFREGSAAHLPWDVRLKIVVGAARGLAFLHSSEIKIMFRDFKSSNILLDGSYTAKLTDFGLVRSGPPEGKSHVTTQFMGTHGYAAPEYIATGHLTLKSDVYSFGIVLLEMLTGLRAWDPCRSKGKRFIVDRTRPLLSSKNKIRTIMDSRLGETYCIDAAFQIAQLALKCLQKEARLRPHMTEVVQELESIEVASAKRILQNA